MSTCFIVPPQSHHWLGASLHIIYTVGNYTLTPIRTLFSSKVLTNKTRPPISEVGSVILIPRNTVHNATLCISHNRRNAILVSDPTAASCIISHNRTERALHYRFHRKIMLIANSIICTSVVMMLNE